MPILLSTMLSKLVGTIRLARCVVLLIVMSLSSVEAFVVGPQSRWKASHIRIPTCLHGAYSPEEYSALEVQEMDELILSLSLEPTDDRRRKRVDTLFAEQLAKPNEAPERFTTLFDQVLIVVGDRVQQDAKKKVLHNERPQEEDSRTSQAIAEEPEHADNDENCTEMIGKSPEERQLWALVDMMVQTKTIVKRSTGELGSKGSFN